MESDLPRDFTYLVQELTRTRLALETIPNAEKFVLKNGAWH